MDQLDEMMLRMSRILNYIDTISIFLRTDISLKSFFVFF